MKLKMVCIMAFLALALPLMALRAEAGEIDVLVNKLVEKNILTSHEAQILLAQAKEEAAKDLAKGEAVTAPAWTQNIKIKGDARFRTQVDWGKGLGPAHERIRNRVRARLGVEGKVNQEVTAGMFLVTGEGDPRSTNQTLDDEFETKDIRLDAYYIKWDPRLDKGIGKAALWLGKFQNPLETSELLWDTDICPGGVAGQYMSPNFELGEVGANLYANTALLWLDEISTSQRDPMMWVTQAGLNMDIIKDWEAVLNMGIAYYDLANVKGNQSANLAEWSAGTNTRWGGALGNTYRYDFNMVDLLIRYDSKRLFDLKLGHGLYSDLIWNTGPSSKNFASQFGGYIGDKKLKDPGQWKLWGEWRYIERDAVPDFMPDSDFYGFTSRGVPEGGGTNSRGLNCGIEYAILKNTVLSAEYYYMVPLDINESLSNDYDEPYQLLQLDVKVKF
ncbi:MAG: putative porin [Candidatus Omnitrophota bacterium]